MDQANKGWLDAMCILGITQPIAELYLTTLTQADIDAVVDAMAGPNRVEVAQRIIGDGLERSKATIDE